MRSPKPINQLSWSDRFSIIAVATKALPSITDVDICKVFHVDADELTIARECLRDGVFKVNPAIDAEFYVPFFRGETPTFPTPDPRMRTLPEMVSKAIDPAERQLFANKPRQRAGKRGNNIQRAFAAVPLEPTPAEEFATKHRVSMAVLRQYSRFDKEGKGRVNVRKDKDTGTIMIWRDLAGV